MTQNNEINVYCDESCHLLNDSSNVMVLGGIICPLENKMTVFEDIKKIKKRYNLEHYEMKWTKISKTKLDFYKEIIQYFFEESPLRFRGLIIPDKSILNHDEFKQTHDKFYYKMYYDLLNPITRPRYQYNIYLDIKDTNGHFKIKELKSFLSNTVKKIQEIRSHEVELVQLADIIIGANEYLCRKLNTSEPKLTIVNLINSYCLKFNKKNMNETTDYCATKYNLLKIRLKGEQYCA